jgi:hypothetical protein
MHGEFTHANLLSHILLEGLEITVHEGERIRIQQLEYDSSLKINLTFNE